MFCGLYSRYMGTDSVLFWCPLFVCFGMLKRRKLRFQESAALGKCLFREREKEKKAMRRNVHGYENYGHVIVHWLRQFTLLSPGWDLHRSYSRPRSSGGGGAADHQVGAQGRGGHCLRVRQGGEGLHTPQPASHTGLGNMFYMLYFYLQNDDISYYACVQSFMTYGENVQLKRH